MLLFLCFLLRFVNPSLSLLYFFFPLTVHSKSSTILRCSSHVSHTPCNPSVTPQSIRRSWILSPGFIFQDFAPGPWGWWLPCDSPMNSQVRVLLFSDEFAGILLQCFLHGDEPFILKPFILKHLKYSTGKHCRSSELKKPNDLNGIKFKSLLFWGVKVVELNMLWNKLMLEFLSVLQCLLFILIGRFLWLCSLIRNERRPDFAVWATTFANPFW